MKLSDLKGAYRSASSLGAGARFRMELEGDRFRLEIATWADMGRKVPGTSRPFIELVGTRNLYGTARVEGAGLVLQCEQMTDKLGDTRGLGIGQLPPLRMAVSDRLNVEVLLKPVIELRFQVYGMPAHVFRPDS